jgi:hypothetical protein
MDIIRTLLLDMQFSMLPYLDNSNTEATQAARQLLDVCKTNAVHTPTVLRVCSKHVRMRAAVATKSPSNDTLTHLRLLGGVHALFSHSTS